MEELLNKLIEKGWKPRNKDYLIRLYVKHGDIQLRRGKSYAPTEEKSWAIMSKRELVSKESGLWQFVCENHLYIFKMGENKNFIQDHFKNEYNECCYQYLWDKSCYEYYLLESALCDEEDLEKFLLDNIKIS